MRRAERIVHVQIGERGQRRRELRIVFLFLRVEPQVFEQHDAAAGCLRLIHDPARLVADAVVDERHGLAEELGEAIGDRPQAHLRIHFALRPAQMAREHDGGAVIERVLDRRQRRADPRVVADDAVLQRDVEIDADEDALALEIEIPDRKFHRPANGSRYRPFVTSSRSRSTQRFE